MKTSEKPGCLDVLLTPRMCPPCAPCLSLVPPQSVVSAGVPGFLPRARAEVRLRGGVRTACQGGMPVQLRGFEVEEYWNGEGGSVLGSGSFGIVFKATRVSDSEAVALKIVACVSADGPTNSVTSTLKERHALEAIGYHPNIVQLKGWEELDPTHDEVALAGPLMRGIKAWITSQETWDPNKGCMVPSRPMPGHMVRPGNTHKFCIAALQLVGEMELYDHLVMQGERRFTAEFLRPVLQQLAEALQHVHSQGFGHFDLKLENAVAQHGQSVPLAVPQLGSCASSGRTWRLWAAQHSDAEAVPLGAQPLPRVLELAASKAADSTAFDHVGTTSWTTMAR